MNKFTVLCLDLGTTTGWATQSPSGQITSGTISFKNDRWQGGGMRYLKFTRWLNELQSTLGRVDAIYFEEVRRHLGVDAAHAYGGFMAHLTAWCEQHNIAYQGISVGTIKRHATGKGNASKALMIESVRRHLGVDAAHAYGGFMAHLTAWCEQHNIAYQGIPVGTIKRHATGKGNASKTLMIESVRRLGHRPQDDNEADALALLHWAMDQQLEQAGQLDQQQEGGV